MKVKVLISKSRKNKYLNPHSPIIIYWSYPVAPNIGDLIKIDEFIINDSKESKLILSLLPDYQKYIFEVYFKLWGNDESGIYLCIYIITSKLKNLELSMKSKKIKLIKHL